MSRKTSFVVVLLSLVAAVNAQKPHEWSAYGGDPGGMKYSPLSQINRDNVATLQVAWTWKSGEKAMPDKGTSPAKFEGTPLMIEDVLYVSTSYNRVVALDANDGHELWTYDPRSYDWGPGAMGVQFGHHRGVATWTDGTNRRVFVNTRWRLIALDAKTGRQISAFGVEGEVDLTKGLAWPVKNKVDYMNSSPPVVYKNLVIVGSAISDSLAYTQSPPGDIQAFDVRTGKRAWIFHTIPQKGEFGNETWEGGSWNTSGHANAWVPLVVDEKRGLLFAPVSTPGNDYYGGQRKGDNLFADSLVCLDANTGHRVWHFQTVHHGLWDRDGVMMPTLGTVRIDGNNIDIVAAPSKTGYTYVFERATGKPVWPIEERPVPQTDVPGERTSPTQPIPTKPPPFAKQGMSEDDLIDFTPELRAKALAVLKKYRYGDAFTPPSLQGTVMMPGNGGGANWGGGAFDPETGLFYVRNKNWPKLITFEKAVPGAAPSADGNWKGREVKVETSANGTATPGTYPGVAEGDYWYHFPTELMVADTIPISKPPYGTLTAIDLNKGEIVWQVPVGDIPFIRNNPLLKGLNLPPLGGTGNSSAIVTAGGLVFICGATDRNLYAFDKTTGKIVWEGDLGRSADATPMTYQTRKGRQFVVVGLGAGPDTGMVALALPAGASTNAKH
jgi:quinoprotein glucose dehydrogenase